MLNLQQRNKIVRRINKLIRAAVADSWKYGGDPDDVPIIEEKLKKARQALNTYLNLITVENGQ